VDVDIEFTGNSVSRLHYLPRRLIAVAAIDETAYVEPPQALLDVIRDAQVAEAELEGPVAGASRVEEKGWSKSNDGLTLRHERIYVPKSAPLIDEILRRNHDDPVGGHYGSTKTVESLRRKYWWPTLADDMRTYTKQCDVCQHYKVRRHAKYGYLKPLQASEEAFRHWLMDFISNLPPSRSLDGKVCDGLLVMVDRLTKFVEYLPVSMTIGSQELGELVWQKIFSRYSIPKSVVSNRDPRMTGSWWSTFYRYMAIDKKMSTAFYT